ncbi:hypothetical protein NECAME_05407 [Necator americanus]|uniref:Receptor ligand binding region domain-containing protein n=1 Tax=Necator americanus TaxID=51031 RepID=W2SJA1_NECAM|nr:hypothetical protein NECAME_05407 [Necator americanus]ETN68951.1 hypothetical protein NECAME_05407 [Necator americanus]
MLQHVQINVGIAAVENVLPSFMAHSLSGGAIGLALDRMQSEGIAYGFQFRFFVNYTECSTSEAVGVAVDFMKNQNMDVVIAPPCPKVIVVCLDTAKDRRNFMKAARKLDMVSDEFVYVLLGMRGQATRGTTQLSNGLTPFWEDLENDHADDQLVKEVSKRILVVDTNSDDVDTQKINDFTKNVGPRVRNDPLYCSTTACLGNDGKPMAVWSRHLHDVFYLYGLSLNDSLSLDPLGEAQE